MREYVFEHSDSLAGAINGFDRLRFRGTIQLPANVAGLGRFLKHMGILLKDAGLWMPDCSERVKKASLQMAEDACRPQYINPAARKEEIARNNSGTI